MRVGQNPRKRLQGELGNLKVYTSMVKCFFERKNASPLTEYILKPRFAQQNYEADFFFQGQMQSRLRECICKLFRYIKNEKL